MRLAMSRFATGVAVVTVAEGDELHGMTVNSLTSVSLEPPLLIVCLMEDARTTAAILATRRFNLSILTREGEETCRRFARRGDDHYRGLSFERDVDGVPLLADALVHLRCSVTALHKEGDHLIAVARVLFARDPGGSGAPLVYFGGGFWELQGEPPELFELDPAWQAPALSW
jgi:flavin reductase (DIM6/NTAB) family NADH-FMN oxidoreductase RutF